jgi:hypothetical protein
LPRSGIPRISAAISWTTVSRLFTGDAHRL